jgi:hypothetical protein
MSGTEKGHVVKNVKFKLPKKLGKKKKHLAKKVKCRSPKHQPICGLYAIARCIRRRLCTSKDVEGFRDECKIVINRTGKWIGRTSQKERITICKHFGYDAQECNFEPTTVGKLFKNTAFFETRGKWLLCVRNHCLFVQTNQTQNKLYAMDQRGHRMYYHEKEPALKKIMRQSVKTVHRVEPIEFATEAICIE